MFDFIFGTIYKYNIFLLCFCFFQNLSLLDGVSVHFNLSTQEGKEADLCEFEAIQA